MNFFEQQEQARQSTRRLLVLFLIAVLAIIGVTDLFILLVLFIADSEAYPSLMTVPVSVHAIVALGVLVVVAVASFYRFTSLRHGGQRVAEEMGGRLIVPSTADLNEKRLINVVEEMAIASGFPVPQVYLLNDQALNAFAAGYTPHDAIVAVTAGTLEALSRDELQGVIAHEFSHILNGDMRLNLRLIGVVFGILFIGLVGQKIIRIAAQSRDGLKFIFIGVGFVVIGFSGLFFGNLIKATISRQREYLADASAVQFTRNPFGISGALKKIGGSTLGTHLMSPNASEYSHLYFSEGVGAPFFGLLNTHPPLKDRIRRVEPSWDGRFVKPNIKKNPKPKKNEKSLFKDPAKLVTAAVMIEAIMATGMPTSDHVNYAKKLISQIPEPLLNATRDPLGAYALVLGLLMDRKILTNITEQDKVLAGVDQDIRRAFRLLLTSLISLDIKYRLPLIELAISPLKSLSENQLADFNQNLLLIINHDGYIDIWEWALHYWLVNLSLNKPTIPKAKYNNFAKLKVETNILLSALAYAGSGGVKDSAQAFADAARELGIPISLIQEHTISSRLLIHAVGEMRDLKPLVKPKFLKALCLVAQKDGVIEAKEIELIRTISEGMGCPMPPVLDGQ